MKELAEFEYLVHYYEKRNGPFLNLSDLDILEAQRVLDGIKKENSTFAVHRYDGYLERRRELEELARGIFVSKGGKPKKAVPHYMVVGECDWLKSWYNDGCALKIPITDFDLETISYSYGDLFPTFSARVTDDREYRRNVYTHHEILGLIRKFGLPQVWNGEGQHGPERYIEVQVWDDAPIAEYIDGM